MSTETEKENLATNDPGFDDSISSDDEAGNEESRVYELGFHLLPTIPEEKISEEFQAIKEVLEKAGGDTVSEDFPKEKVLAYKIFKEIDGKKTGFEKTYFGWIKFKAMPDGLLVVKKEIEERESVLRFLLVKTVKENTMVSPDPRPSFNEMKPTDKAPEKSASDRQIPAEEKENPASKEEIDKSIDKLVDTESK